MSKVTLFCTAAVVAGLVSGCQLFCCKDAARIEAKDAGAGFKVDGTLDGAAWNQAKKYNMVNYALHENAPAKTFAAVDASKPETSAYAKVMYDKDNLYIGFTAETDDLASLQSEDQQELNRFGDSFMVFLKPEGKNGFIQFMAGAGGNKTSIVFPSRSFSSSVLMETQKVLPGFRVYVKCDGTLNKGNDVDKKWSGVMVISRKMLEKELGAKFDGQTKWNMLIWGNTTSRRKIYGSQFSYPELPKNNPMLTEYYAPLELTK